MTGTSPASGFQQRIWLADQFEPGTALYNVPMAWRLTGRLDRDLLRAALADVVRRHEALRTAFVLGPDGMPRQAVEEPWQPEVDGHDLSGVDPAAREDALAELLRVRANATFDPAAGRLLRVGLVELGGGEQVLFLCAHHLVWDEGSAQVFLRDLDRAYTELAEAGSVPASPHQQRVAFIDRFENGVLYERGPVYHNLSLLVRLPESPEPAVLRERLAGVFDRHEALRTNLVFTASGVRQRLTAHPTPALGDLPAADVSENDLPPALLDWLARPFDLADEPLLRCAVQREPSGGAVLALSAHQAVADRASLWQVAVELLGGPAAGSSFVRWAREVDPRRVAADVEALAVAHGDPAEPLALPEQRARAAVHVYREESVELELPASLEDIAARLGGTVEATALAGLGAVLSWYTGQPDLVIGTTRDLRAPGDGTVVGPMTNLVPLRLRPEANRTAAALVEECGTRLELADRHRFATFEDLVLRVDPAKDMSRLALFDVLYRYVAPAAELPGGARPLELDSGHGKYDLHAVVRGTPTGHTGRLVYNAEYFDREFIAGLAEHLGRWLELAGADPAAALGRIDPSTGPQRTTQLVTWNDTAAGFPDTTLDALVLDQARRTPDRVAVSDADTTLTYAELAERAEAVARGLVATGVRQGDLVALRLPRGVGQVVAMLAVLRAGAGYLPIDPDWPADRVEFLLSDSGARLVVGADGIPLAELASAATGGVLPDPVGNPAGTAYCVYTSGTTGRPKGVLVTHRNAVRLLTNDRFPFRFGPRDVWTMLHSYSFDFSVWEVFGCLSTGGRLLVPDQERIRDPRLVWRSLVAERVTVLNQTPGAFLRLIEAGESEPDFPADLRYVVFGGERLDPRTLAGAFTRFPDTAFVNMYGITEGTVHATVHRITQSDVDGGRGSVIGRPIPTTTVRLLDRHSGARLVPVGSVGEICLGGLGVAVGYLRRPELTDRLFRSDPFGPGRLFHTGDLARYRPDGTLEFIGRADARVKVRGYRIEPGEVEAVLREHERVADAVVLLDEQVADSLAAFVRPSGEPPDPAHLRAHLAERLPSYQVPARYFVVDEIPLTGNGKVDVGALWATAPPVRPEGDRRPPATPTAAALAVIWAELLGAGPVSADDSFFDLGGHSLLGATMLAVAADRLGVRLPLRSLFERPTLQHLADLLDEQDDVPPASSATEPEPGELVPASGFQERIWLAARINPAGAYYNVSKAWRIRGRLDPAVLGTALAEVVRRNEILRTAFVERVGRPYQLIQRPWTPRVEHEDLRELSRADQERRLERRFRRGAEHAFALESGRLLQVTLSEVADDEQVLFLCTHHLVWDAGTAPLFLAQLGACYDAAAGTAEWPAPAVGQYRDFVAAEDVDDADLEAWADLLEDAPALLPLSARAPEPPGIARVPLEPGVLARLRQTAADAGGSWFMAVATAVAGVLHRFTGADDLTFGCVVSLHDQAAGVLGPCLNMTVLRSRQADADGTLRGLLADVREAVLDTFDLQHVPFGAVLERLDPPRSDDRTPYADVALNVVNGAAEVRAFGGSSRLTPIVPDFQWEYETKFALTVNVIEEDGELSVVLSHRGDRFGAVEVRGMADWLAGVLGGFDALLDRPLPALDLPEPLPPRSTAPSALPQYRDFVAAEVLDEADLERWADRLSGAPSALALPAPARPEPHGVLTFDLPTGILDRLRTIGADTGGSWFMVLATTVAAMLHRWTGLDDVAFGCPIARRGEFPEVLGPCLNMIVLRSTSQPGTTLGELLAGMRETVLDAFDVQHVPFGAVVERLNPPRKAGSTPYADISLIIQDVPEPPVLAGRTLHQVELGQRGADYAAKFALGIGFTRVGDELTGAISYRGDRFGAVEVRGMADWLAGVLGGFAALVDRPLTALSPLTVDESRRIAGFEHGAPASPPTTVPELLAAVVAARPDAAAVHGRDGVLGYRELHARAAALAERLRPHRRGDQPVLALHLGRGADMVVAMLASWYAGYAFCPLDPTYPSARIEFIIADLDACAVLTDEAGRAALGDLGVPTLTVAGPHSGEAATAPVDRPDPESTAYVIYTSGTTGRPKGVAVRHRGLAQLTRWTAADFGVGPTDRVSQIHSVGFDVLQWETWSALTTGACLCPHEDQVVPATLPDWLARQRVSVFFAPTPVAENLWAAGASLPGLRWMFIAGSALTARPPDDLPYRLCNAYGPTETTVIAAAHVVEPADLGPLNRIGRPIAGTTASVLDTAGNTCPVGVPGELVIGGQGVARGYWRRPDLTADKFPHGGARYRTGDLARWLSDGTIEFLGRIDRQLKIRGYRVEPQEVEAALQADPRVGAALVRPHPDGIAALVAYLVPAAAGQPNATAEVLTRLRGALPTFMVPESVVWLDEFPLNQHGKLDQARLPRPTRADLGGGGELVAPAEGIERRIASVWSKSLGLDSVGAHDRFFDIGGNSLLLAKMHRLLESELDTTIPIRLLFEHTTVHALATVLDPDRRASDVTRDRQPDLRDRAALSRASRKRASRDR